MAGKQDQPTDRLLPENDTTVWTAGGGKIPCEGYKVREFVRNAVMERRMCTAEKKVNL